MTLTLHVMVSGIIMIKIGLMTSKVVEGGKSMELIKLSDGKKREEKPT